MALRVKYFKYHNGPRKYYNSSCNLDRIRFPPEPFPSIYWETILWVMTSAFVVHRLRGDCGRLPQADKPTTTVLVCQSRKLLPETEPAALRAGGLRVSFGSIALLANTNREFDLKPPKQLRGRHTALSFAQ
jgi:hypothetical protein